MPYGMAIVLVFTVTALFDSTRPGINVVLAPNVIAALLPGMMVPRNTLLAPIEAAPPGTQNTLELPAFALPSNFTVTLATEVNAAEERKMYTPGLVKVRMAGELTDIVPVTQCTPGSSGAVAATEEKSVSVL
jgi:hypothetical protein